MEGTDEKDEVDNHAKSSNGVSLNPVGRIWPSLGLNDPCSTVRWGQAAGVHWQIGEATTALHASKDQTDGGAAPLVPAAASHVLLTLPKAAHNLEVHLGSSEKGFESAGNQLASWANGTSLVTIFPAGDARDEIAAVCRERRQAVQEAGEPEQGLAPTHLDGPVSLQRFLRSPASWQEVRNERQYRALAAEATATGLPACRAVLLQHCLPRLTVSELQRTLPKGYSPYALPALKALAKVLGLSFGFQPNRARLVEAICDSIRGSSRARGPSPGAPIEQVVASAFTQGGKRNLVAARAANAAAFYEVYWGGGPRVLPLATVRCAGRVADVAWNPHARREAAVVTEAGGIQLVAFPPSGTERTLGEVQEQENSQAWGRNEELSAENVLAHRVESSGKDEALEGAGPSEPLGDCRVKRKRGPATPANGLCVEEGNDEDLNCEHDMDGSAGDQEGGAAGPSGLHRKRKRGFEKLPQAPGVDPPKIHAPEWQKAQATGVKRGTVWRKGIQGGSRWWRCVFGHDPNSLIVANRESVTILTLVRREGIEVESERCLLDLSAGPASVAWEPGGLKQQEGAETVCALARSEVVLGGGRFLVAVGTSRRVLLWDTRKGSAPLLQWDHCLAHAPPHTLLLPPLPLGPSPACRSILAFNGSGDIVGFTYAVDTAPALETTAQGPFTPCVPLYHAVGGPYRVVAPCVDQKQALLAEPAGLAAVRNGKKEQKERRKAAAPLIRGLVALTGGEEGTVKLVQLSGRGRLTERMYASSRRDWGGGEQGREDRARALGIRPAGPSPSSSSEASSTKKPAALPKDTKDYFLQPLPAIHAYVSRGQLPLSLPPHSTPTLGWGRKMDDRHRSQSREYLLGGWEGDSRGKGRAKAIKERWAQVVESRRGKEAVVGGRGRLLEREACGQVKDGPREKAETERRGSSAAGAAAEAESDIGETVKDSGLVLTLRADSGDAVVRQGTHGQGPGQALVVSEPISQKQLASRMPRVVARSPYPLTAAEAAQRYVEKRLPRELAAQVAGPSHAGMPGAWGVHGAMQQQGGRAELPLVVLAGQQRNTAQAQVPRGEEGRVLEVKGVGEAVAQLLLTGKGRSSQEVVSLEVSARRFELSDGFHLHSLASGWRGREAGGRAVHRRVVAASAEEGEGELSRFRIVRQEGSTLGQETALSRLADLRSKWRGWQEQKAPATLAFSLRSPASLSKGAAALVPVPQAPFLAPARPAWLPRNSLLGERAGHRGPPTPEVAGPNPAMEAREIFDSEILKMDAEEGVPREDSGHVVEDPPPKRMLPQVRRAKKRSKGGRRFTEGF